MVHAMPHPHGRVTALALALSLLMTSLAGQEGVIIFTGSANGAYKNCLCPDKPLGGVEGSTATSNGEGDEDPIVVFESAVEARVAAGSDRKKAVSRTVKEDPDRHQRYVAAANEGRNRREG